MGLVLDAGCGGGVYILALAKKSKHVVSLDISKAMIEIARTNVKSFSLQNTTSLILGDIESLPFKDERFDSIVCSGVIEHLLNMYQGALELARTLKNGGHLTLLFPNYEGVFWKLKRLGKRLGCTCLIELEMELRTPPQPERSLTDKQIKSLLRSLRLKVNFVEGLNLTLLLLPLSKKAPKPVLSLLLFMLGSIERLLGKIPEVYRVLGTDIAIEASK